MLPFGPQSVSTGVAFGDEPSPWEGKAHATIEPCETNDGGGFSGIYRDCDESVIPGQAWDEELTVANGIYQYVPYILEWSAKGSRAGMPGFSLNAEAFTQDILIVDDEEDIRELVAGILSDEGHETRTAHDSDSAMAAIADRVPRLVFLDIWLQGSKLDGLAILDQIKTMHPGLPVVMVKACVPEAAASMASAMAGTLLCGVSPKKCSVM